MALLDEILENQDKLMESADRENAYYGDADEGCCYKCNCQWSVEEICYVCEQCPDCCECEK